MKFNLPIQPPVAPMLATSVDDLPEEAGMIYEPKWDGFRCIVFRDGDGFELSSRGERPLTRYFPELIEALSQNVPQRCVLDGEIVIAGPNGLDFDALTARIHPAESRVKRLATEMPASFVAFDVLAIDDDDLRDEPFAKRREILTQVLSDSRTPIHVTPATTDVSEGREWFERFEGAGLDGIIAKSASLRYQSDKRAMFKIKHKRTADCVVAGFRWHKESGVGSLLLGLYDEDGVLHHVGVATSFAAKLRLELVNELDPWRTNALSDHPWQGWAEASATEPGGDGPQRRPGAQSRWNAKKDLSWEPLRPERVLEVSYDHLQRDRFRHATRMVRWRDDRDPASCTYAQLQRPVPETLRHVFESEGSV